MKIQYIYESEKVKDRERETDRHRERDPMSSVLVKSVPVEHLVVWTP